jgi:bifunctional DNA-binding transcriptional regulator/antitoxin component of YhaV-PrlF toxin-antitoxin module
LADRADVQSGMFTPAGDLPPHCVVTAPDRAGRIADRSPVRHMGWSSSTATGIDVRGNAVIVVTAEGCTSSITRQGHLRLPLPVRRLCRIEAGVRVLVVAWRDSGQLVICTTGAIEEMVLTRLSGATGLGRRW